MRRRSARPPAQIASVVSGVLRALTICAPVALVDVPTLLAQPVERATLTADIPAQPLSEALTAFVNQTGLLGLRFSYRF